MDDFGPVLRWVAAQQPRMVELVGQWAGIGSGTFADAGLARMRAALQAEFGKLPVRMQVAPVGPHRVVDATGLVQEWPLSPALVLRHDVAAPLRVFLGIHMDTVYGPDHAFTEVTRLDENTLRGPGVADAKGGLVVMLVALEALSRSPWSERLAWEVLINADEEIGSPGSQALLDEAAARCRFGLLFEPAVGEGGSLISTRKGSGGFTAVFRGRSAHAGRDPASGRSAIHAMARFIMALHALPERFTGLTVNAGKVEGGGPVNVVPQLAICRFNLRVATVEQQLAVTEAIEHLVAEVSHQHEVRVELHGQFRASPKPLTAEVAWLMEAINECGRDLALDLTWIESGGVSDGNRLAAAGLPNIDSLGPRGGAIHSPDEFLLLNSLTERASLVALLLMKLAAGRLVWSQPTS